MTLLHSRFLLLVVPAIFLSTSCNEPGNKKQKVIQTTPVQDSPPKIEADGDPTFVITDTFPSHGPRNITRNLLADRDGNIWFASWEGITKYDGKAYTNYTLKENLRRYHVFSAMEDKSGNLWFGTIGGGIYRYDPRLQGGQAFSNFTTEEGLASNTVYNMTQDLKGNIWIGTNNGVSRFDGNIFTNYSVENGLSHRFIYSIMVDKSGQLWLGTFDGINIHNPSEPVIRIENAFTDFKNDDGKTFRGVKSMTEDRSGNVWLACEDGLWKVSPGKNSAVISQTNRAITKISDEGTVAVLEDKLGTMWLSSGKLNSNITSLSKYDGKKISEVRAQDKQLFCVIQDKTGNIWFGTESGAYRFSPEQSGNLTITLQ